MGFFKRKKKRLKAAIQKKQGNKIKIVGTSNMNDNYYWAHKNYKLTIDEENLN